MKAPDPNKPAWEGEVGAGVQKRLRHLSLFLQQRSRRLSHKGLRVYLVMGLFLALALYGYVILSSLQPSDGKDWQVTPIKAFPLPPPAQMESQTALKDTLLRSRRYKRKTTLNPEQQNHK